MRGTFANIRLRNQLAPGTEGGVTRHMPDGEEMTIYDAAMKYAEEGTPLIVLAGKEYGSGSSRDWAAKGTNLLGVRAVIAESFERIHRSNLVGMGVLPLQFADGENAESLGLTGEEEFSITGVEGGEAKEVTVRADDKEFTARVRIDTPKEVQYYQHGGILPFVLRQLLGEPRCRSRRPCAGCSPQPARPGTSRRRPPCSARRRRRSPRSTHDTVGSTVARVPGTGGGRSVAVVGHIDEIGLIVHHIDDDGFLWFTGVGGWDPIVLVGQRVEIATRGGVGPGRGGQEADPPDEGGRPQEGPAAQGPAHRHRRGRRRRGARGWCAIGDVAVIAGEPVEFPGGRFVSRSMDNRLGCYVALEAARLVAEAGGAPGDVYARGGRAGGDHASAARARRRTRCGPDVAIAVDVTFATDQPGIAEQELGRHRFGSGPVLTRGSTLDPLRVRAAARDGRGRGHPVHRRRLGARHGHRRRRVPHLARRASRPRSSRCRCATCTRRWRWCSSSDVENAARLIAAFALRLPARRGLQALAAAAAVRHRRHAAPAGLRGARARAARGGGRGARRDAARGRRVEYAGRTDARSRAICSPRRA